jgi:hypothetical protein
MVFQPDVMFDVAAALEELAAPAASGLAMCGEKCQGFAGPQAESLLTVQRPCTRSLPRVKLLSVG